MAEGQKTDAAVNEIFKGFDQNSTTFTVNDPLKSSSHFTPSDPFKSSNSSFIKPKEDPFATSFGTKLDLNTKTQTNSNNLNGWDAFDEDPFKVQSTPSKPVVTS